MEEAIEKKVWYDYGNELYLKEQSVIYEKLDNAIYVVNVDVNGNFYLVKEQLNFIFDYKIYGLEEQLINRIIKTYTKTKSGNIGILLNGLKGTGKTCTGKIICNQLKQPVIVVAKELKGCHLFINAIPQDITVFIDEYEKIFGQSPDMLTIMDGALNSEFRRVFILTTNELYVDKNLLQRPSRIRYLKKFSDLSPAIVEEIVDDVLEHKQFKSQCIKFISSLEVITVDIVKAVIQEVNLHEESPEAFQNIFNVKKLTGKFNIEVEDSDGTFIPFVKSATVNVRPMYGENNIDDWFSVNDVYLGKITNVLGRDMIEVTPVISDNDEEDSENKKEAEKPLLSAPTVFKVEDAEIFHYNYTFGNGKTNRKKKSVDNTGLSELANTLSGKSGRIEEDYEYGIEESD